MTKTTIAFPLSMDLRRATLEASGLNDTYIIDATKRRVMTVHGQDIIQRNRDADFIVGAANAVARATGRTASALAGVGTVIHEDDLGVTVIPMNAKRAVPIEAKAEPADLSLLHATVKMDPRPVEDFAAELEDFSRPPGAPDLSAFAIFRIIQDAHTDSEYGEGMLRKSFQKAASRIKKMIDEDRTIRQESLDADLRAHIESVERTLQSDGLRKIVERAISNFSSPTVGQGSVHGGQAGFILYERDGVPFVVQAVCEAVMMATRTIAKRLRDGAFVLTAAELQEIAQELACLPLAPSASLPDTVAMRVLSAEMATFLLSELIATRHLVSNVIRTIIPGAVQQSLTRVVERLDALRTRINKGPEDWQRWMADALARRDNARDDGRAAASAVEPTRWSTPALAWVVDTFGSDQGCDQRERAARFLEEAIEVGHVLGVSFAAVSALVTRTYLKPPVRSVSNIRHELGQAEFTLALLVELFAATPPGYLGEREFHRVRALGDDFWRARHAAKVAGIESVASMAGVVSASDTITIRDAAIEECARELEGRSDAESTAVRCLRALKAKQ